MTDVISVMRTVNRIGTYLLTMFLLLNFIGIAFATDDAIASGLKNVCTTARSILAVGAMLMVVLAAIVYALGQVMGAETRARATVWATAMLTGGLIGVLIYVLVPNIIAQILSGSIAGGANPCDFAIT